MKTLLRLAALAAVAWCASAATHVQITLTINDGTTAAKGYLYAVGPKGGPYVATSRRLTIGTDGAVDTNLQGCPACYYDVEYHFQDAQGRNAASPPNEKWFIPVTATTLTSRLQLLGGSAAPANMVNPQQVNAGGLLPGQLWIWSGTAWEAAYPASSSDAGVADPGGNGVMVRSALNVSRPATFADIVALFSGAGDYLKRDGTLGTPAGGGGGGTGAFSDLTGLPSDNTALNSALSAKANTSDLTSHAARQDNPHVVTKTQVGLPNVVNFLQLQAGLNLSDLSNVVTARSNLGLGAAALLGVGQTASTVAAGDHLHSSTYAALVHGHAATEITSGVFGHARLGTGGTGGGANVLWDDGTWHAPPGASGGEANTSSNGGTGGIGLVLPKSGMDLPFKSLIAGSSKLTVTDDAGNKRVSLDVAESAIVHQNISGAGSNTHAQIDTHLGSTANPHSTTKAQVGLGGADNTADTAKPVSTAQQAALDLKANIANPTFTGTVTVTPAGGLAGVMSMPQGTANTPTANTVGFQAPTSVPAAYLVTLPSAPAAGYVKRTNANPSVESVGAIAAADLPAALANSTSVNGTVIAASKTILYTDTAAGSFPTLNQNTLGNAATATALAADPTACTAGQYVNDIAANGTLTCGTPAVVGGNYQTVISDSATMTQRAKLNLKAGTGVTLTPADNAGADSSEITIAASSSGGGACYTSATQTCADDAFFHASGNYAGAGSLNWTTEAYPGATWAANGTGVVGHPGLLRGSVTTTAGQLYAANAFDVSELFDATYVFRTTSNVADVLNTTATIGLASGFASGAPTSGFVLQATNTGSAGNWIFRACKTANCTTDTVDTGVTASTSFVVVRIRRVDSTTVGVSINGGNLHCITSGGSAPAACTGTNKVSATMVPTLVSLFYGVRLERTSGANTEMFDFDYARLKITGLTMTGVE